MIKVAIFPCGSEIALEIHNSLKYEKTLELYGASSVPCHGRTVFKNYDSTLPFIDDDNFEEALNSYLKRNEIDFIFPAYDDVIVKLAEMGDRLVAKAVIPSAEVCKITRSKSLTYKRLEAFDFCPQYFTNSEAISSFPVFSKPDKGQGSQGIKLIENREQLEQIARKGDDVVFCEYLPGKEYTIDCFTDRHGQLLVCSPRERKRVKSGISVSTQTLPSSKEIERIANTINTHIPIRGTWFFQLKEDVNQKLKLLEVAPRIAGSMATNRARGVNYALLSLYNLMEYDVSALVNDEVIQLERYLGNRFIRTLEFDHVYLDFDDTLTHKGKVNLSTIQFIYHCMNNNKNITLITRHAKNILETLSELKLSKALFKEIIHLTNGELKSDRIDPKGAIFIDDSFSERAEVKKALDIPVFSVDMVASLIDWTNE